MPFEPGTPNAERGTIPRSAFRTPHFFLMLVVALGGAAPAARADEFDTLRLKWRDMLTQGTNANPADPLYSGWIGRVGYEAQRYWSQMATNAGRTFLWSDLAPLGSHYTHRVICLAVRLVVEDGLPYRAASWHLWRDHRVFAPYATIQNWVEGAGKKGGAAN